MQKTGHFDNHHDSYCIFNYFDHFNHVGSFVVLEGSEISCVGKIRTPDDYCLNFQHLMTENNEKNKDFEVVLNTKDIYKDLKVRGYDYGKHFQKLLSLKTNDFNRIHGEVEWDGNWVTFVDSLIQCTLMAQPMRKPMVPFMIKYLRCEPNLLSKALHTNKNKDIASIKNDQDNFFEATNTGKLKAKLRLSYNLFRSTLPYYRDTQLNLVIAPGLEIEGVLFQAIPRKGEKGLTLESYKFIANEESFDDNRGGDEELNEYLIRSLFGYRQ